MVNNQYKKEVIDAVKLSDLFKEEQSVRNTTKRQIHVVPEEVV